MYTWAFSDWKTHKQIDHILKARRWNSSILDVRRFREADCDTDHYVVVEMLGKLRSKKGYQPRTYIVNVGKHDLFADYQFFRYVEELFLPTIERTWG